MKSKAIVALIPMLFLAMLAGISTMPAIATPGLYDVYWEPTYHPKGTGWTLDPATASPSWPDTELVGKLTGAANHIEITYQDYPSYTFVKEYVEVYDKKEGLYEWKGATLEYYWMSDWRILAPDDALLEPENILFHMKDYFVGLSKFDGNGELQWQIYRQYAYWIQTEDTATTATIYGPFPEAIGERLHVEWDGSTYISSTVLWQATSTYFVIPVGASLSTYYYSGSDMDNIYGAFPDAFTGFGYKWLP